MSETIRTSSPDKVFETVRVTSPDKASITLEGVEVDRRYHDDGWLLDVKQATAVAALWADRPIEAGSDVVRVAHYTEIGAFYFILHTEGHISVDEWESAEGAFGEDIYATHTWPLAFYVIEPVAA